MGKKIAAVLFVALLANTAYIGAFATPSVFYMGNVLLHLVLGVLVAVLTLRLVPRPLAAVSLLVLGSGVYLAVRGATYDQRFVLWAHIAVGLAGAAWAVAWLVKQNFHWSRWAAAAFAACLLLPAATWTKNRVAPNPDDRIRNPKVVPASMEEEGGGPSSPFWPSSAKTNVGGTIPSDFFMDSKLCGECHKDAYEQWNSSVHHFASFNNQYYRKSIEQMQELGNLKGTKWCASCHDHAVFFNGRFEKPIKDQIDTPEAQNGLGCVSCHSITKVEGSMGNGGFTIEYPKLHDLASSKNKYIRAMDTFLTYLDPEPHRRTFMKPFMREDASEYCSACHKVHLDVPVNNYRWIRGFNDYDNWQASGVSGQGARSFYYPPKSSTCTDCHMPLVDSKDPGNRNGKVHNHRFPGANTAVAHVNNDEKQLQETRKFLKSGFISVDIFAASPVNAQEKGQMRRRATDAQNLASFSGVGEEAETAGNVYLREVGQVSAPLDRTKPVFRPGETVRMDVVVRTRKIGHFFPGGTIDSFDIWLELKGVDATGKTVFWSGMVEEDGKGPVEPGAHFYRSFLLDGEGNPINKRNAWQARSVFYVRTIPPGAADVAHYRVKIPEGAKGPITFTAKLNLRKFSHYYNQYAYAGKPVGGSADKHHDSREYSFDVANVPANVSGARKGEIPVQPITVLAEDTKTVAVGDAGTTTQWGPKILKQDRERWNDWGIGMLLQGDLKGAEYAFQRVTEAEPEYADGWLNIARALIQEGETEAAKGYLEKALARDSSLPRIHFFRALIHKTDGEYDQAIASLAKVTAKYPRDRVVLNQVGRVLFLQRKYPEAIQALEAVLAVDPEDVQAHYTLMLAYRGAGQEEKAAREEKLFRRFKADESSTALTQKLRLVSPEDNNERQMIHDHESVPLNGYISRRPNFQLLDKEGRALASLPQGKRPNQAKLAQPAMAQPIPAQPAPKHTANQQTANQQTAIGVSATTRPPAR